MSDLSIQEKTNLEIKNVIRAQGTLMGIINSGWKHTNLWLNKEKIFAEQLARLDNLILTLENRWNKFFSNGMTIEKLQSALNKWNQSGAARLVDGSKGAWASTNDVLNSIKFTELADELLAKSGLTELWVEDRENEVANQTALRAADMMISALNSATGTSTRAIKRSFQKVGKNTYRQGDFGQQMKGLSGYISVEQIGKGKNISGASGTKWRVSFDENTPASYKERLWAYISKIDGEVKSGALIDTSKIYEAIVKDLNASFSIGEPARSYIAKELSNDWRLFYDLNMSSASAKGFLGELYWTSFFKYMRDTVGLNVPVMAAGTIRNDKGQEIQIDGFLSSLGYQVKNYSLKGSGQNTFVEFKNSMSWGNFITSRLQQDLSPFQEFYSRFSYNKPVPDATEKYEKIYNRFRKVDAMVVPFFLSNADKILRLEMTVSDKITNQINERLNDALDLGQTTYNDFYLIAGHIVPAINIIRNIRDNLAKGEGEVKFEIKSGKLSEDKLQNAGVHWDYGAEPGLPSGTFNMTSQPMAYQITIKIPSLEI